MQPRARRVSGFFPAGCLRPRENFCPGGWFGGLGRPVGISARRLVPPQARSQDHANMLAAGTRAGLRSLFWREELGQLAKMASARELPPGKPANSPPFACVACLCKMSCWADRPGPRDEPLPKSDRNPRPCTLEVTDWGV